MPREFPSVIKLTAQRCSAAYLRRPTADVVPRIVVPGVAAFHSRIETSLRVVIGVVFALSLTLPMAWSAAAQDAKTLEVKVEDGRLWVVAENIPLAQALKAIAQQLNAKLHMRGDLDEPVTRRLKGVEIADGLRALARKQILIMEFDPKAQHRLKVLRVYAPSGAGAGSNIGTETLSTNLPGKGNDVVLLIAQLRNQLRQGETAEQRRQTISALAALQVPRALEAIGGALRDTDISVRREALDAIDAFDSAKATQWLGRAALSDNDKNIRYDAIEKLAARNSQAAQALIAAASKDADPAVRKLVETLVGTR
ncbi:MAG: hypothetical protein ACI8PT_004414 [Gammaproteobacteria bacterium]|jgi:hypothetical protein